jgi:hypothetical protein
MMQEQNIEQEGGLGAQSGFVDTRGALDDLRMFRKKRKFNLR